jgi:hypothetical protein
MALGESHHEDLAAALGAHRDLGRDYDRAIAESVVDRMSRDIDARVDMRVTEVLGTPRLRLRRRSGGTFLALSSLALGIPISAISGAYAHATGLAIAWGGIAVVNLANAWRRDGVSRLPRQLRPPGARQPGT